MSIAQTIQQAAQCVLTARSMLIGAGAGMGVDSGLPDFRGPEGFWRAYPALRGHSFAEMANPRWFEEDPTRAWGFYGHRLNLYRDTVPHAGFDILHQWSQARSTAVFTSNVDGQFQKAGFDASQVCECHGSIHHLQTLYPEHGAPILSAEGVVVDVDEKTVRARHPLPRHPKTQRLLRPNILMFGDGHWQSQRTDRQHRRLHDWYQHCPGPLVVIEIGAGTSIPSVRHHCEQVAAAHRGHLIRINPRESFGPAGTLSLPMGGLAALQAIAAAMESGR